MKNNKVINFLKRKDVLATLSFSLVAFAALVGIVAVQESRKADTSEEAVEAEDDSSYAFLEETEDAVDGIASDADNAKSEVSSTDVLTQEEIDEILANNNDMDVSEEVMDELEEETEAEEEDSQEAEEAAAQARDELVSALDFTDNDMLSWPLQGNVVLDYSMDKSVYFSTLEQYKYNPALIISADVNTQVVSAADAVVESIVVSEETGTTVTTDLGNGFKAVYGQLKEVPVYEGDIIEEGSVIGYVSEPTKYYTVEGSNLYFQLVKDSDPVDPMTFLP